MTQGRLILVPNSLDFGVSTDGDLQDVLPLGALRTAARLTHWVAENAKTTRAFLKRVDAIVPLAQPLQGLSIVELPRPQKGARQAAAAPDLKPLLQAAVDGVDVGLISEAGLPAIADPGAALVQAAHALGIAVLPLSGPSSLLMALGASGLNGQSFAFVGYLPVDGGERGQRIRDLEALSKRAQQTQLMIETPYRNEALLGALLSHLRGDTWLSVSSGLTLPTGWTHTARVSSWKGAPRAVSNDVPAVFSLLAG
ncbi:SAM-dependent methyltransferase [Rhizobacter sp. Root1221]|uniref:SAM-dependent methyltransferase n=1 Tax=Rhizobacter sp. Root1221 TaxID=1736433 RepID=UPI0006F596B2|nr:SAM-dependent methyltransferase [Rhizobacter sp. Root1221]KQV95912.1 ribosomal RNA small subunit methyltransferase I [Rhizobacter sp. Root1221]